MKLFLIIALPFASVLLLTAADEKETAKADATEANKEEAKPDTTPVPVDDDMHHLMEYVFKPAYRSLKTSVATEPKERKEWSAVKAGALTLAESSNLLLHRLPEEDSENWIKLSIETREAGSELYQAARKKTTKLPTRRPGSC